MTLPFHLFSQSEHPGQKREDKLPIMPKTDIQWGKPLFRAPALTMPAQFVEELRFTADFRAKDWLRR